jgi:hypothetical protein
MQREVSTAFDGEPFANGLRRLLGGMNFTLQYDHDGRLATLTMLSNDAVASATAAAGAMCWR